MASGGTNNNDRPFSISRDEDLARMLQEEEYNAVNHEDEQLARRLQRNIMTNSDGNNRNREMQYPLRSMTPITQLFSDMVSASLQANPRHARRHLGLLQLSSDEEDNIDTDNSDSTVEDDQEINTSRSLTTNNASMNTCIRGRGASRGTKTGRSRLGFRPTETVVHVSPGTTGGSGSDTQRSIFSTGSDSSSSRTNTSVRGRPPRGRGVRGTRRTTRNTSTNSDNNKPPQAIQTRTGRNVPPCSMEPSVPPLSLAMNQPELPDGEMEPEILILDRGSVGSDAPFLHIMRDPMLLLLFLMGRAPTMMVPDDIDPTDYEALWELAERLGEVKNRGLSDDELKTLSTKKYRGKTKFNVEGPQCLVCLSEYKSGESLVNLPCTHEYHDNCIREWLKRNASCPICRHDMKKESP